MTQIRPGNSVKILGDPEEEIFEVLSMYGDQAELENEDHYIEGLPIRLLVKTEKPEVQHLGTGAILQDKDGDLWVSNHEGLFEFLTVDRGVRHNDDLEFSFSFTETLDQVKREHGPVKVIYAAP